MRFAFPWAFLLLILILPVSFFALQKRVHPGVRFSSIRTIGNFKPTLRRRFAPLPEVLRIAALVLITFAIARPQAGIDFVRDVTVGIAIELIVDRSGSMAAEMNYDGDRLTRLETVKRVIDEFVNGGTSGLEGRPNDLIGLIAFARYADTICPLTLSHQTFGGFLDTVRIAARQEEDGTSIGDAVALAAARLQKAEDNENYEVKSKVIILLTDGLNNTGRRSPMEAAALARDWGIKVYAIGIGGDGSLTSVQIDEAMLSRIAEETGGLYRTANDADALRAIYSEINDLEKSEIETVRYVDYKEAFPSFVLAALGLLALAVILSSTVLRRIP